MATKEILDDYKDLKKLKEAKSAEGAAPTALIRRYPS